MAPECREPLAADAGRHTLAARLGPTLVGIEGLLQLGCTGLLELAHTGAVTFIQRFDSALRLNPHPHTLALDGVCVRGDGATR